MSNTVRYFEQADMYPGTGTSLDITGVSWQDGDVIIVAGGTPEAAVTIATPTNANLTFSLEASVTDGGFQESPAYMWSATATSTETNQTINAVKSKSGAPSSSDNAGIVCWVITGEPSGTANAAANRNESTITFTPTADSVVCYFFADWNATNDPNKTPATGTGTATERHDEGDGATWARYACDWVGVTATSTAFGPNNYTSLRVGQVIVEVLAATSAPSSLPVRRRDPLRGLAIR